MALKYDGFKEGDRIKAYDHEPAPGRRDRFVIGEIRDIVRASDSDEASIIPYDAYRIWVEYDATFENNPRKIVIVPMEVYGGDFDGRVELLGANNG